jgi:REP element-mobilizing transposase RayT
MVEERKEEYRRKLPHIVPANTVFFITYRIAGSLPLSIINKYQIDKKTKEIPPKYFEIIEDYLDTQKAILTKKEIAKIIEESLWYYNDKYYKLIAFCIMPNHVHLLINTNNFPYKNLFSIMKLIKGVSSNKINKRIGKKGQFWQHESYDRMVRDRNELGNIIDYILNNPVKAKLVNNWKEWNYTYIDENYCE